MIRPENIDTWEFDHVDIFFPRSDIREYENTCRENLKKILQSIGGEGNLSSNTLYQEFLNEKGSKIVVQLKERNQLLDVFGRWLTKKQGFLDPGNKYIPLARQKTLEYLRTLFEKVELHLNAPYPYDTQYKSAQDNFFVAMGPKHQNSIIQN